MTVARLTLEHVDALRAALTQFGGSTAAAKTAALGACARRALDDPEVLIAYHDALLFALAYPETAALRNSARRELRRVAGATRALVESGPARVRSRLENTGLAWSALTINFGWDIARWLVERFPRHAELDQFGVDGARLAAVLQHALPPAEFELVAGDEPDPLALVLRASAGHRGTKLAWLVHALRRLPCSEALREHLFDALQPFLTIRPAGTMLSRTFVRGLAAPTFFHRTPLIRTVDLQALVATPLGPARRPSASERVHIVDAGRAMLAALGRETDAVAGSYPDGVAWHDLGRGAALALYTIRPDHRGAFDSHVGFLLFRNGLPVGYGGGWPFLGTCKIGVNIFAPYRGGESAWLFGQVLRVYAQRFAVQRFVAEPSQIGHANPDGLKSGAYWFYYRLGFRSAEPKLARVADEEFARMTADRRYRSPIATLRRFTRADLELPLAQGDWQGGRGGSVDPADLSLAVSDWIARRHRGDRGAALAAATRSVSRALGASGIDRWPDAERGAFGNLSLLFAQIPGLARWPHGDRRRVVQLMRAKGGDEFRYFALLQRHRRLRAALEDIARTR
ncbi:MAG: hypothetical protein ABI886_06440 [Betaproteobacteria bacterium]